MVSTAHSSEPCRDCSWCMVSRSRKRVRNCSVLEEVSYLCGEGGRKGQVPPASRLPHTPARGCALTDTSPQLLLPAGRLGAGQGLCSRMRRCSGICRERRVQGGTRELGRTDEFPACTQQPRGGRRDELRLHRAVRQQLCPRRGLLTLTPQQLGTGYRARADEKQKPELTAGGFGTKVCRALWAAGRSHCTVTRELPAPCCAFSQVPPLSTRPGKVRRRPRGAAGKCCQRPEASPRAQRLRLEGQRSHRAVL